MILRILAAVVFAALVPIGFVGWIGGRGLESGVGFAAFLTGLVGLILADIAWSLGCLVEATREKQISSRAQPAGRATFTRSPPEGK
jgi:hypothetical protein